MAGSRSPSDNQEQSGWNEVAARQAMEAAPIGMVVVRGAQHSVVFANAAYRRLQLQPDVEPIGQPFATINPPALGGGGQIALLDMVRATRQPHHADTFTLPWRGDTRYTLSLQAVPLGTDDLLVMAQAIAVPPAAPATQSAPDVQQVQTLIGTIPEGVAIYAADGRYTLGNSTAHAILGLPDDLSTSLVYVTDADPFRPYTLHYPDGRLMPSEVHPMARTVAAGEVCQSEEMIVRCFDGRETVVLCSTAPLREANGAISGGVVVLQSLERLRREEQSRQMLLDQVARERDLVRATIAQMPEAVVIINQPDGSLKLLNHAASALIGEVIGGSPARLLARMRREHRTSFADFYANWPCYYPDGSLCPMSELPLVRALNEGKVIESIELAARRPDGSSLEMLISAAPVYAPGADHGATPVGAVAVFQDISRLKEVDRLKDTFLSIAAHELKTPLTSIKGYAQLLLRKADPDGPESKGLRVIERQVAHLDRLVNQLLELSRIQESRFELHPSTFDLVEMLSEVAQTQHVASDIHDVRLHTECFSLLVEADRERLMQVVMNLVNNGIRYSPNGGPIDMHLRFEPAAGEAILSVQDQGVGIPADYTERIFDQFVQAPNAIARNLGGMGLGLYISNTIVRAHQGRIRVESVENEGSTFYVHLPVTV